MTDAPKWIAWIEPFGPENEPVFCMVPPATAIAHRKAAVAGKYEYPSDEEALEDFKAVHWAWEEEPPEEFTRQK